MNMTAEKFWNAQRESLHTRRDELRGEATALHTRLTEINRETSLLDDVIVRLDAHLPAVTATKQATDVVPLRKAGGSDAS